MPGPAAPTSVLHVSPFRDLAGANRSTLTMIAELRRQMPTAVVAMFDGPFADAARALGVSVETVFSPSNFPSSRWRRWQAVQSTIARGIEDHGANLVHNNSARAMRFSYLAARRAGVAIVTHQRDEYRNNLFHLGLGRSDAIISISKFVHETLPARLQKKSTVIYNAVQVDNEARRPPDSRRLRIGAAGRWNHDKGFDLLLDAATPLMNEHDFELHLWGCDDGEYAQKLRSRLETETAAHSDRVFIEGFRPDIDEFYRSVDIVVVPSRFKEPFGRMAIEAMAYGCVVVAAGHGGLTEIIDDGQNGLTFKPEDAADLRARLVQLIGDPALRSQLAARASSDVVARFSPQAQAQAVIATYKEFLAAS